MNADHSLAFEYTALTKPERVKAARLRFRFGLRSLLLVVLIFAAGFGVWRHFQQMTLRREQCANKLKRILLAMWYYHDDYGCFPSAYIADDDGTPMHSWRVMLLPYLDEESLYEAYDFSEPWNGPNNIRLASRIPAVFVCPDACNPSTTTNYLAVTGAPSLWPGDKSVNIRQVRDGASNTIALVEVANSGVSWLEPGDLPSVTWPITGQHDHFARVDGSVLQLLNLDTETYRAMTTINGGEVIQW